MPIERTISKDVFLSYAHDNEAAANEVYNAILDRGGSAFLSGKDLHPGDDFPDRIRDELQSSRELWVLMTPESIKSEWVQTEWGAAWALGMKIVPIFLRCSPESLPERIRRKQGIDYHRYRELVDRTFAERIPGQSPTDEERHLIDELLTLDRIIDAVSIGKPYLFSKRFDKCLPIFEYIRDQANKNHYDYYVVLGNIGYSLIGLGRNQEAIQYFDKVRDFHRGETFFAWHALATAAAYLRENKIEQCKELVAYARTQRTQQFVDVKHRYKVQYPDLAPYLEDHTS